MPIISGSGGGGLSGVTVTGTAAAGEVPVASSSSAGAWAFPPGYEIVYSQITSNANITDTSEATATALITATATFDGAPVICQFYSAQVDTDSSVASDLVGITLFEGSTQITRLAQVRTIVTASRYIGPVFAAYRFTPTAGSHTYKLCAYCSSTTGTPAIEAGSGGTGANPPAYIRFIKV